MYRTNDPRFRRRLNDISHTLESANESAQSSLYVFGQRYVAPCLASVTACFATCIDASCPSLNVNKRQRTRTRTRRPELSFDFYDDWDEDEGEGLLGGWGDDEFDRLVGGYGTVAQEPVARKRGMSYSKGRRKSGGLEGDPTVIPGPSGLWGRLFGGRGNLKYKPSAAGLQVHPGAKRKGRDLTEGERLLEDADVGERRTRHRRERSDTAASHETVSSYSSRGDIFPSDEEDDAIPLDDEFAMVLERRTTNSAPETESSSNKTGASRKRGKRPSAGSRTSTRRTVSSRSTTSRKGRSRTGSTAAHTPIDELNSMGDEPIPSLVELKQEERRIEMEEEEAVQRRRSSAQRAAEERGLAEEAIASSKEAMPRESVSFERPSVVTSQEPSQLPTPLPTDDDDEEEEEENAQQQQSSTNGRDESQS